MMPRRCPQHALSLRPERWMLRAAVLTLCLATAADAQPPAKGVRTDLYGDPLPPGAVARLGTVRYRGGPGTPLPDGKTSLVSTPAGLHWVDAATGRRLDSWLLPRGYSLCGFSPAGRLALVTDEEELRLWDLVARKEVRPFHSPGQITGEATAVFSPDNKVVATAHLRNGAAGALSVWDVASGRELWREGRRGKRFGWRGKAGVPAVVGFLPDGRTLVLLDRTDNNRVQLRERDTGEEIRSFPTLPAAELRTFGLTPDGRSVLMGTAGTAVRAWELVSGKELPPLRGHHEAARVFAVGRDGKTVLTGGNDPFVLVHEWPTGKLQGKLDLGEIQHVESLGISADGRRAEILAVGETVVRRYDLATGRPLPGVEDAHPGAVFAVAVTADGRVVSAGRDKFFRVWDFQSQRQLHAHPLGRPHGATSLALDGSEKLVATAEPSGGPIMLHERDTGRLVRQFARKGDCYVKVGFVPGRRLLAASGTDQGTDQPFLEIWDVNSGRQLHRIKSNFVGQFAAPWAFSRDGSWLAMAAGDRLRLLDTTTWRERPALTTPTNGGVAVMPDNRTLVTTDTAGITLWELASRKVRCRIRATADSFPALAISPDGLWLALGQFDAVRLYDAHRGRMVHNFIGHDHAVRGLAFGANGRTLVSCSSDTTILVWDIAGTVASLPRPKDQSNVLPVAAAWDVLAGADAAAAYQAIAGLAEAPAEALPLLRERLRPAPATDPNEVQRLLDALDSRKFTERQRAAKELERILDQAEAALHKYLKGALSAEARVRAERLLNRIEAPVTDGERLRALRALEVLERIGTPGARDVLRALAGGAPQARLTREARQSLERLAASLGRAR